MLAGFYILGCNGEHYTMKGTIESPGYPLPFDNNLECINLIRQQLPGSNVTLTFQHLDILRVQECSWDFVWVC